MREPPVELDHRLATDSLRRVINCALHEDNEGFFLKGSPRCTYCDDHWDDDLVVRNSALTSDSRNCGRRPKFFVTNTLLTVEATEMQRHGRFVLQHALFARSSRQP